LRFGLETARIDLAVAGIQIQITAGNTGGNPTSIDPLTLKTALRTSVAQILPVPVAVCAAEHFEDWEAFIVLHRKAILSPSIPRTSPSQQAQRL